jgi:hypothetical protein
MSYTPNPRRLLRIRKRALVVLSLRQCGVVDLESAPMPPSLLLSVLAFAFDIFTPFTVAVVGLGTDTRPSTRTYSDAISYWSGRNFVG